MPRKCERDVEAAGVVKGISVDPNVGKITFDGAAADLRNAYSLNCTHGEGFDPGSPVTRPELFPMSLLLRQEDLDVYPLVANAHYRDVRHR